MANIVNVPVIIIGGGGCGLTMSCFLSDFGIEHFLFERHQGTSLLPKAHYLNQRTMEILRQHHMADEIIIQGAPLENFCQVAWATSLGGSEPTDRQLIHKRACFGGDDGSPKAQMYKRDAPLRSANLPLLRLEPILRALAENRNPGRILFSHNVSDFIDQSHSVLVTVQDSNGVQVQFRCQYLIGADGGRFVGPKIGVQMEGPNGITDMVSIYFKADLSEYWDDRYFACHFINGSCATVFESGALVPLGPIWGRYSEEWVIHFGFDLDDDSRFDEDKLIPRVRALLKLPNLDIKVLRTSHWILERVLANKYSEGRVFLAGDAAHRRPPTTGLGLNTSIEDSLNLAWKLALVLKKKIGPEILDTYEYERRPIGRRNCDWGLFTFKNSSVINAAVGLIPGQEEANKSSFTQLFEDSEIGRSRRAQVALIVDSQCIEFSAHDIELGFHYDEGFRVPDGTDAPDSDPFGQVYVPTTRPGHRLPHAWVERNSYIISTHDLVGSDGAFLVITDLYGSHWVSAAQQCASIYNIKITTAQFGPRDKNFINVTDHDEQWEKVKGVKRGGVLLVRPDNFVAWRSRYASKKEGSELAIVISSLMHNRNAAML